MITARFLAIAEEFKNKPVEQLQAYIDMASEQVTNINLSASKKETLVVWLAAHMATIALHNFQAGGAVSSVTEDKLQITYNTVNAKDSLDTTRYGLEYKRLCRMYIRYIPSTIWI